MAEQNKGIKISDLPQSVTFTGLWTLGYQVVDGVAVSVRVSLEEIQAAYEGVKSATADARQAVTDSETLRIDLLEGEASRTVSESERQSAEIGRAAAEAERDSDESERKANEADRKASEIARSSAEEARKESEATREANERTRAATESARVENEIARESAELTRKANEDERKAAESSRQSSEDARDQAESDRGEAEDLRQTNEDARQLQESQRSDAESARQSNETTREENEQARISAEEQRAASEAARGEAEAVRESNEETRQSNESTRQETESTRVATEIEREANELTRKSNESNRQAQEAERQANTATAITNAETATASANTAAQNAIKAKQDTEAATELANELNDHPWIIQQGVWYKWNTDTDQYESTGLQAKGDKGDTGTVGIMLDAEPTEDTLTYTVGDVTYNFELGMSAIYPDSESDNGYGLSFFMGTTSEGKAIWGKGGGGAGPLNETVVISLVSNQDEAATPDADLLGKPVHVIYGDQDKELVWQGEALKVTVPMNMGYQVVFPTDDRYKCPDQQEYIAVAGGIRSVNGLYYTEAVTVNVTCDDNTSAEGQQVTINGTVYDVDATGRVTAKIPFDVEYTVSVNTKSGYTSPSSVTETANSKSKTISMEYILIVYGVFIEATDGTLHESTEWTGAKTANSIVVRQPTTAFRIAITQSSSTMKIHSSDGALENYMTAISNEAQAKLDMKSAENTANIMKLQSGTYCAAGYCNAFTFPDGKTKGLLPALGWLWTAYDNKAAVDACLAACGATAMDTSNYHWASTFMGLDANKTRNCWRLRWSDGMANGYGALPVSNRVRPFAEYA